MSDDEYLQSDSDNDEKPKTIKTKAPGYNDDDDEDEEEEEEEEDVNEVVALIEDEAVDDDEVARILTMVGLDKRADESSGALPEGQRKLLDIAMALIMKPRLLILDEPTSGVSSDEKHGLMKTIMNALDAQKVTAIFVEHDVDIVSQYSTRVAAWIAGRIAADGSPEKVLANPEIRKNVIGE